MLAVVPRFHVSFSLVMKALIFVLKEEVVDLLVPHHDRTMDNPTVSTMPAKTVTRI